MSVKRTIKISTFDVVAALVFLGNQVTPEEITQHIHITYLSDIDKYELLKAVKDRLAIEMEAQTGDRPEDHYGIRKHSNFELYWLAYNAKVRN